MAGAGLAEMHLAVNHAGQDMEARAVNGLACRGSTQIANRRDDPAANTDITLALAIMVDNGGIAEEAVKGFGHGGARAGGGCGKGVEVS